MSVEDHPSKPLFSRCPYCERPADSDGCINHIGGCFGLESADLNQLQHRGLTDEIERLTRERDDVQAECGRCGVKLGVAMFERDRLRAALNSAVLMVEKLKVFGDDNVQRYDVKPWLEKVRERFPDLPGPHQFWGLPDEPAAREGESR